MISSFGDSGLPVFQAGHWLWQRPHSVQVAMSSIAVHLKSSTLATPNVSTSGSASSSSRTLPLDIIGSRPPSAVRSGWRLVRTLSGAGEDVQVLGVRDQHQEAEDHGDLTEHHDVLDVLLARSPSGSSGSDSRYEKNGARGWSCQGETPVLSCAARIPNSVSTTRKISPRTSQAAPVCEP